MIVKPQYIKYYKKVLSKAIQDTKRYFIGDWRGWVVGIVSAIIGSMLAVLFKGESAMDPVKLIAFSSIGGAVSGLLFLFIINWALTPAKLFREKEIYANKESWKDIEIKEIEFQKFTHYRYGLLIKNNKPFDIQGVSAKLTKIIDSVSRDEETINRDVNNLPWVHDGVAVWKPRKIEKNGGERKLAVLNWGENEMWFDTGNKENPNAKTLLGYLAHYIFEIELSGTISGKKVVKIYRGEFEMIKEPIKFEGFTPLKE